MRTPTWGYFIDVAYESPAPGTKRKPGSMLLQASPDSRAGAAQPTPPYIAGASGRGR